MGKLGSLLAKMDARDTITSALVVCRSRPEIEPLPHVRNLIASLLIPSGEWTIERAIPCGYLRLAGLLIGVLERDSSLLELEKRACAREEGSLCRREYRSHRIDEATGGDVWLCR